MFTYMSFCKDKVIFIVLCGFVLAGCRHRPPDFYENLYTGEMLSQAEFRNFVDELRGHYSDSLNTEVNLRIRTHIRKSGDSVIASFKYDIKSGTKYIIRAETPEKLDMIISPQKLLTISGDSIMIGGQQEKPMMINLWFIECPGCIAEMPNLNKLQKKYADKMNFVAMTFESETHVKKFLRKKSFDFTHIVNADNFIKCIGTHPYPESIFINKQGQIKFIESAISGDKFGFEQFDAIIEDLLSQEKS
jgi:thiol-disulfide isomerase/thioredoxin